MPHATTVHDAQEEQDDLLIQQALDPENPIDFTRNLEPGEKADDAVNFSDLSDDDLAEEEDDGEDPQQTYAAHSPGVEEPLEDLSEFLEIGRPHDQGHGGIVDGDVLDDLFGERSASPVDNGTAAEDTGHLKRPAGIVTSFDTNAASDPDNGRRTPHFANLPHIHTGGNDAYRALPRSSGAGQKDGALSREQHLQQQLFAMSGAALSRMDVVPVIETQDDLLAALWPRFERDTVPRFMNLLPPKKARYVGKNPLRRPRPVQPTRLNLEIATDQEKSFRLSSGSNKRSQEEIERQGLITIQKAPSEGEYEEDEEDLESDFEHDPVGGVSWQDLQIVCGDWDTQSSTDAASPGPSELAPKEQDDVFSDLLENLDSQLELPAAKVKLPKLIEFNC